MMSCIRLARAGRFDVHLDHLRLPTFHGLQCRSIVLPAVTVLILQNMSASVSINITYHHSLRLPGIHGLHCRHIVSHAITVIVL